MLLLLIPVHRAPIAARLAKRIEHGRPLRIANRPGRAVAKEPPHRQTEQTAPKPDAYALDGASGWFG